MRLNSRGLDAFLSIFAPVRRGEGLSAFLLMVNAFLLLTAYYVIKPVREALILSDSGAEIKSYAGALQALSFLFIIPIYGRIASRVNRLRLINGVTLFFISNLVLFYFLGRADVKLGIVFFLWVGLFNLMLVAQFWAFANDVYSPEQGRRLFAIVGTGTALGAIFGAKIAGWLFEPIGPYPMMLVAAGLLGLSTLVTLWIHFREGRGLKARFAEEPAGSGGGFELVLKERYLFLIAVLVLLSNFVNTTGEFILGKTVALQAESAGIDAKTYIGEFYSDFFFWVNLFGAALQMFAVSRIMKFIGVGQALFFLPLIALGSYTLLAFAPVLAFIRIAKIAENSTDYSIQNTARHALFLPTSRDAKYKAQAAIESFFWRAGDALSGLLVFVGTMLALGARGFAVVNIVLVLVWLGVASAIVRIRKQRGAGSADKLAA